MISKSNFQSPGRIRHVVVPVFQAVVVQPHRPQPVLRAAKPAKVLVQYTHDNQSRYLSLSCRPNVAHVSPVVYTLQIWSGWGGPGLSCPIGHVQGDLDVEERNLDNPVCHLIGGCNSATRPVNCELSYTLGGTQWS